jgi:thiol:disulfide interchange protein
VKKLLFLAALAAAPAARCADAVEIGGVKYECRDGMCMPVGEAPFGMDLPSPAEDAGAQPARMLSGYVGPDEFVAFLEGRDSIWMAVLEGRVPFWMAVRKEGLISFWTAVLNALARGFFSFWVAILIALVGGFFLNLTPCVLPLAPVTLMVIGRSAARGIMFALGLSLAYGLLGVLSALFGSAFGALQGSPWFSLAVAVLFVALGAASLGLFSIDLSRWRSSAAAAASGMAPMAYSFFMGVVCAALAGACVAPVVFSALAYSAALSASGCVIEAVALPFALGLGMAAPWPFAAAGLKVFPKPGKWMRVVNFAFAAVVLALAAKYAYLAWRGFAGAKGGGDVAFAAVFKSPEEFSLDGLKRPVLVDCRASWCGNCAAMERTTLRDPAVKEALSRFTFVAIDAEDISALKRQKGFAAVVGLPAYLVFE